MISQVEISQSITDGEEQKTETTAAELNSENGVRASTGVADSYSLVNSVFKRITYVTEGEPEPVEVEYEFKNELYLASKSKGIILHENPEVSPHYFINADGDGEMTVNDKIRLLFNLDIQSTLNPDSLSVERMGDVVTDDALGDDYSFTVDGRVVHIILGESTNLQPGDMIIFTESAEFHPVGEINEGHRCMGKVQEKPIQHLQDNDLNNKTIVANQVSENHLAMISKREQVYYLEYFYNSHRLDSDPLLVVKGDKRLEKNTSVTPSFIKKGGEDNQVIFGFAEDSTKLYRHTFRFENDFPDAELITSDPVSEINLPSEGLPCNESNHHRRLIDADQIDLDRDGILDLAVTYSCVDQNMRTESEGTPREQGNHFLYKASINYICLFLDNGQDFYEQKECLPLRRSKKVLNTLNAESMSVRYSSIQMAFP